MCSRNLTSAQERALAYLGRVGNASRKVVKRAGFNGATFDALCDMGLAEYRLVGIVSPGKVYYELGTSPTAREAERQRASVGLPQDGSA